MTSTGRERPSRFRERIAHLAICGATIIAIAGVPAARGGPVHALIRCPVHADERPSCSVHLVTGRARCFACGWTAGDAVDLHRVLGGFASMAEALRDLETRAGIPTPKLALRPPRSARQPGGSAHTGRPEVVRRWVYRTPDGAPAFEVHRLQFRLPDGRWEMDAAKGKVAKTYRPTAPGGSPLGMPSEFRSMASRPLLNLPRLLAADLSTTIYVVEGEPAAAALHSTGRIVTTSSGGASNAHMTDWSPLAGRHVVIWPDNDEPGIAYADSVASLLSALTPAPAVDRVDVAALNLPRGGDAADWLRARNGGAS